MAWYDKYTEGDFTYLPCRAVYEYDGKLNDTNPIFGTYNVTFGTRIYANASDTNPKALPDQTFQVDFTPPETDLSNIYEEKDVPEEKAAEVIYLDKKFRRYINATYDNWDNADGKFYWLRVVGGYKLYGNAYDAEDRWFFRMFIERPTSMFIDGEI